MSSCHRLRRAPEEGAARHRDLVTVNMPLQVELEYERPGARLLCLVLVAVILVPGFPQVAIGGELGWGLGAGIQYTDNARLTPASGQEDWIYGAVAGLNYIERNPENPAYITAILDHREYKNDTYAPETLLYVDATARWVISPQRFSWMVTDVARPVVGDPRLGETPQNRTGGNAFGTGPEILFRLSGRNAVGVGGYYVNIAYQDNDADSDRYLGYVRWLHNLDSTRVLSANLDTQEVAYRSGVYEDYRRDDWFIRYGQRDTRSDISLDLGYSVLNRERQDDLAGWLGRLRLAGRIMATSGFALSAFRQLTDTGNSLLRSATDPLAPPGIPTSGAPPSLTETIDLYLESGASLDLTHQWTTASGGIGATTRKLLYNNVTSEDRSEHMGRIEFMYLFTPRFSGNLFAYYVKTDYLNLLREDETRDLGIRLSYQMGRHVYLVLTGSQRDRGSSDPLAEYKENRGAVSIAYSTSAGLIDIAANTRRP